MPVFSALCQFFELLISLVAILTVYLRTRIHLLTEWTIPAFSFPAEAGTHQLPTLERWKAEFTLGGWLVTYQNKCLAPGIEPLLGRPSQY